METVSVVVPAYQASRVLPACLEAIEASDPAPLEVLVVDDGPSTDGTGAVAQSRGARVITMPRQMGPGGARNAGVAAARGEILVFVDSDVRVHPNAVGMLVRTLTDDPELVAAFGSYDTSPPERSVTSQYKNLLHHFVHQRGREDAISFWAGLGAVRRGAFEAVGGFDAARYGRPSIEDIELGYRLLAAGGRMRLVKLAQGTHLKRWTLKGMLKTDFFDRGIPWTELILDTGQMPNDLNLGWRHRMGVAAAGLALAAAAGALFFPRLWVVVLLMLAIAVASGGDLFSFFARERGLLFALRTIPLHLAYFVTSGLAFAVGTVRHLTRRRP